MEGPPSVSNLPPRGQRPTTGRRSIAVYSSIWHPHKSWIDIIFSFIFSLLMPLTAPQPLRIQDEDNTPSSKEATILRQRENAHHAVHAQKMRQTLTKISEAGFPSSLRRWSKYTGCDMVEATIKIKRNDNILEQWNIISSSDTVETLRLPEDDLITVHAFFSVKLLPNDIKVPTEKNEFGCLVLDDGQILTKLAKNIPIVLFFHGGGMTLGSPRTVEGVDLLVKALETRRAEESSPVEVIFLSVRYSLAPEHPFPTAPIEACSVVDSLLDQGFEALHLLGVSAGGYLALVGGLEAYRGHAGKSNIRSICAACPMLNPACDSLSCYQNETSSYVLPVPFLRWCYRVYLELPEIKKKDDEPSSIDSSDADMWNDLLARKSNRQAWNESKWAKSSWRRLIEPAVDVPTNWKDGPQILITTNAGDPLHDDGVAMVTALQASHANVSHQEHQGSHWVGTAVDAAAYGQLAREWSGMLFGKGPQ